MVLEKRRTQLPERGHPSPVKGRHFEREHYTNAEVRALLSATSGTAPVEVRNRALITTLWQSGLRINEALELRPGDVDLDRDELFVRFGKGGYSRRVRCGPDATQAIREWLAIRGLPADAPLFCTLTGNKLYDTYVRSMLQRLARVAGWTKRIHPHGFRHTFAVNLASQGMPAAFIQRQLGHRSLGTTTVYLSSISTDDIGEAMSQISWD